MKAFRKGRQTTADITQWLLHLRAHPSTPESGFNVTTIFRARAGDADDYYFGGVNVENPDHRIATHGEEGSMAGLVTGLGRQGEIAEIWLMGAPRGTLPGDGSPFASAHISNCGKCRQQIINLAGDDVKIHSVSLNGDIQTTTVGAFMPAKYSLRDMGLSVTRQAAHRAPTAVDVEKKLTRTGPLSASDIRNWLTGLESLDYLSHTPQAAVLRLGNGAYVAGVKMEEAAFQSMNAAQCAVALAVSAFGEQSVEEVFVYTGKAPANHYGTLTMSALQTLLQFAARPDIPVHYLNDTPDVLSTTLTAAAAMAPTSKKPFYKA